jgi:hypothetical protein
VESSVAREVEINWAKRGVFGGLFGGLRELRYQRVVSGHQRATDTLVQNSIVTELRLGR